MALKPLNALFLLRCFMVFRSNSSVDVIQEAPPSFRYAKKEMVLVFTCDIGSIVQHDLLRSDVVLIHTQINLILRDDLLRLFDGKPQPRCPIVPSTGVLPDAVTDMLRAVSERLCQVMPYLSSPNALVTSTNRNCFTPFRNPYRIVFVSSVLPLFYQNRIPMILHCSAFHSVHSR